MAKVKFNEDPNLGQTIDKKQLFSFGAAPITQFKEIVFASGGNKFSQLCGFRFTSKAPIEYKEFFISFVCKLRSKIYRQATANPSQWFIFKKINNKEMHCMDKKTMLDTYGFDVDKFFDSDYFENSILKFETTIRKGLDTYIPEYVKAHGAEKAKDLLTSYDGNNDAIVKDAVGRYATAIKDSLQFLSHKRCNDKFYKLISYDIKVEGEKSVEEDDIVSESNFECIVKKELDGFAVYEKDQNVWVATFANEIAAEEFAKDYPKLKADYIKKAAAIEAEDSLVEDDKAKVNEAEKLYTLKMLQEDLDDFINTDAEWNNAPVYVQLEDGNMYGITLAGMADDGYILLTAGKKIKLKKEAEQTIKSEEPDEKIALEKELDDKIEEALKNIYR